MFYRKNSSDMTSRVLEIANRLLQGEALSVNGLVEEFDGNITKRTLQRDFKLLSEKLPIVKEDNLWMLKKLILNDEDLRVVEILESLSKSQGKKFEARARKILSHIEQPQINTFYTKLNMEDISSHTKDILELERAIKDKHSIDFTYKSYENSFIASTNPLKIINDQGFWYLLGYDTKQKHTKKYHLKSISNVKISEKKFRISKDLSTLIDNAVNIWFDEEKKPFEVRIFVPKEFVRYFTRIKISKIQRIEPHTDGNMELILSITHEMEVLPLIKSWLPHLRVLEPKWLADIVINDIKAYIDTDR